MTTLTKTWQPNINFAVPNGADSSRYTMWWIKEFLKGGSVAWPNGAPTGGQWTVVGSSDGLTATFNLAGATDLWGSTYTASKLNWDLTYSSAYRTGAYNGTGTNRNTIANLTSVPKVTVAVVSGNSCTFTVSGKATWDTTPTVNDRLSIAGDLAVANRGEWVVTAATSTVITATKRADVGLPGDLYTITAPVAEGPITLTSISNFICRLHTGGPVSGMNLPHSWICLKSPNMSDGPYYLTFDCVGGNTAFSSCFLTKTAPGALGGTVSQRPTFANAATSAECGWDAGANDGNAQGLSYATEASYANQQALTCCNTLTHCGNFANATGTTKLHGALATDGSFWMAHSQNGTGYFWQFFTFSEIGDSWSADSFKAFMFREGNLGNGLSPRNLMDPIPTDGAASNNSIFANIADVSTIGVCGFKSRSWNGGSLGQHAAGYLNAEVPYSLSATTPTTSRVTDQLGGQAIDWPIYLSMTSPYTSRKGRIVDFAWSAGLPHGTSEPTTSPYTSCTIGRWWVPLGSSTSVPSL